MPPRLLTTFEAPIAQAVVDLGNLKSWEFAAFLETTTGPLIELRSSMRHDGADPSQDVHTKVRAGASIIVHHNHLSQESLSWADWRGLVAGFEETFAHCADGTIYWGRVIDRCSVEKMIRCNAVKVSMDANNHLSQALIQANLSKFVSAASFFEKEVICRAMRNCAYVEYEYQWGANNVYPYFHGGAQVSSPAGILGCQLDKYIDQAAQQLASTI